VRGLFLIGISALVVVLLLSKFEVGGFRLPAWVLVAIIAVFLVGGAIYDVRNGQWDPLGRRRRRTR